MDDDIITHRGIHKIEARLDADAVIVDDAHGITNLHHLPGTAKHIVSGQSF
jgi:hypothetical protein